MDYLTSVELPIIEEGDHSLLDAPAPDYTVATVRRAFIVWLYCGQKNRFRDVCDYYHRLEMLEDKMTPEQRAASRHHEFTLFNQQPPTSAYLKKHHPTLYTQTHIDNHYLKKIEAIQNQYVYENLSNKTKITTGYSGVSGVTSGATKQEIVDASQTIKNYCLKHKVSLKDFLKSFKEYAERCGVKYTITNIEAYIKKKMVEKELDMVVEYSEQVKMESTVDNKTKEMGIEAKFEKNKVDDECRIIAESTVKDLIDFNDIEDKNKTSKKKGTVKKGLAVKLDSMMDKGTTHNKENRTIKVQKSHGTKEDTMSKEDSEESFKSIQECDESCISRNTGIKEVDINVNGEAKPVILLKRDKKQEANMKRLNTSFQDLSFVKIQTT